MSLLAGFVVTFEEKAQRFIAFLQQLVLDKGS